MRLFKWLTVLVVPCFLVRLVSAQEETRVRDLTDGPVNEQELIEALVPQGPQPRSLAAPNCDRLRSRGIDVRPVADPVAVKIEFDFDSDKLSPEATANLEAIGKALTSSRLAPCCFRIEGHTDDRGSQEYNEDLSVRRARSVVQYLARRFEVDPDRLLVEGRGERSPLADNDTDAGRQKNRRVQLVNLGYGQVTP